MDHGVGTRLVTMQGDKRLIKDLGKVMWEEELSQYRKEEIVWEEVKVGGFPKSTKPNIFWFPHHCC